MTQIITDIVAAAHALKNGEVVAFPTETVYGLGAIYDDKDAVHKIFSAKGRPSDNPLIVHITNIEDVKLLATEIPESFYRLAERFWPGPLTIVLKRAKDVPNSISAGLSTVAVRLPDHPIARALIEAAGKPLVAPSANLSGRPSPTCAQHVHDDLNGKIYAILDGGSCRVGLESTVVSLVDPKQPLLLRPGKIEREEIESVLGMKMGEGDSNQSLGSPGRKYRHYAPSTPVKVIDQLNEALKEAENKSIWLLSKEKPHFYHQNISHFAISCENFYALLRRADQSNCEQICIFFDKDLSKNSALCDRMKRAAGLS